MAENIQAAFPEFGSSLVDRYFNANGDPIFQNGMPVDMTDRQDVNRFAAGLRGIPQNDFDQLLGAAEIRGNTTISNQLTFDMLDQAIGGLQDFAGDQNLGSFFEEMGQPGLSPGNFGFTGSSFLGGPPPDSFISAGGPDAPTVSVPGLGGGFIDITDQLTPVSEPTQGTNPSGQTFLQAAGDAFGGEFNSADVFANETNFTPLNPEDFRYRQSNLDEFRFDPDTINFPDLGAFRTDRMGTIANSARVAQEQLRQDSVGSAGGPANAATDQRRLGFLNRLSAGQQGSALENEILGIEDERARFIGNKEEANRALMGQLTGQQDALSAQNLGLLADVGKFNELTPINLAGTLAQFTGQDQVNFNNSTLAALGMNLNAILTGRGLQAIPIQQIAQMLTGYSPLIFDDTQFPAGNEGQTRQADVVGRMA